MMMMMIMESQPRKKKTHKTRKSIKINVIASIKKLSITFIYFLS
jgi:hypothetical protein